MTRGSKSSERLPLLDFADFRRALEQGATRESLLDRLDEAERDHGDGAIWIHRLSPEERRPWLHASESTEARQRPLSGLPFAIKDNIDLARSRSTAACPSYQPEPADRNATVVDRLVAAGAVPLGKTNMDQFATGLVGVRSPYGVPRNPFASSYIPGGSSSGSAVAVAAGLCAFSLGTDTAGSGRVPAALNNLVGYKPTRGLIPTTGVIPACRSLDCVSVFARSVCDAAEVARVAIGFDSADPYSRPCPATVHRAPVRPTVGVPRPDQLDFHGDEGARQLFERAVSKLRAIGATLVEVDYEPFREAAALLYDGPWVAERTLAVGSHLQSAADGIHPVTRQIILGGLNKSGMETFRAMDRLEGIRQRTSALWREIDAMLTPTIPTVFTLAEVAAEPLRLNSILGTYTNHFNLLDLCGIAVPAGFLRDGLVPWGVTFSAPAFRDDVLFDLASRFLGEPQPQPALSAQVPMIDLVVCGAHLKGLPLNGDLVNLGGTLVRACRTSPEYRLHALAGAIPPKPGLVRVTRDGASVEVEVWRLPQANVGRFLSGIRQPLGLGLITLEDGAQAHGFLCESAGLESSEDITAHGGWRNYLSARTKH